MRFESAVRNSTMMNNLFQQDLSIHVPRNIKSIDFDESDKRHNISIDSKRGGRFADDSGEICPVHDTMEKNWRYLIPFQYESYLYAKMLRIKCSDEIVRLVSVLWASVLKWIESEVNNNILVSLNALLQAVKRKARGYKITYFKTIAYFLTAKLNLLQIDAHLPIQS